MATREYNFVIGVTTSSLPTATSPSDSNDIITLGYANSNFVNGVLTSTSLIANLGIANSVGSSALTIALKQADGSSDPTSGNPVRIKFRDATLTNGNTDQVDYTAATSVVVPSTATLGHASGVTDTIYVYAVYDGTNKDIGVSSEPIFDESELHDTTTISTGADSRDVLYTTTGRTGAAVRLLAILRSTQSTAGTWAAVAEKVKLRGLFTPHNDQIWVYGNGGHGSTDTRVRSFTTTLFSYGDAITYADTAANGATFTINQEGIYTVNWTDLVGAGAGTVGITRNSTELTTNVISFTDYAARLGYQQVASGGYASVTATVRCLEGDIIRAQDNGSNDGNDQNHFRIVKIGD